MALELTDDQREKLGPEFIKEWEENGRPWLWAILRVDLTDEQIRQVWPARVSYQPAQNEA